MARKTPDEASRMCYIHPGEKTKYPYIPKRAEDYIIDLVKRKYAIDMEYEAMMGGMLADAKKNSTIFIDDARLHVHFRPSREHRYVDEEALKKNHFDIYAECNRVIKIPGSTEIYVKNVENPDGDPNVLAVVFKWGKFREYDCPRAYHPMTRWEGNPSKTKKLDPNKQRQYIAKKKACKEFKEELQKEYEQMGNPENDAKDSD